MSLFSRAMRQTFAACSAVATAGWLGAAAVHAGTLVEFANLQQGKPAQLRGYLARPGLGLFASLGDGGSNPAAPYPAVVVLHGCSGLSSHSVRMADDIATWGYVALAVDSLGPRGIPSSCGGPTLPDQAFDAYAALRYLAHLDVVDPARVAVFGESMGGSSVLQIVNRGFDAPASDLRFRAAVAYYPICGIASPAMTAPTLLLIGEADESTLADVCQAMVEHVRPDSAPISLTVYPGVHHAFNVARFQPGVRVLGHRYEYNQAAASDAEAKVRAFLASHLAGPRAEKPGAH